MLGRRSEAIRGQHYASRSYTIQRRENHSDNNKMDSFAQNVLSTIFNNATIYLPAIDAELCSYLLHLGNGNRHNSASRCSKYHDRRLRTTCRIAKLGPGSTR